MAIVRCSMAGPCNNASPPHARQMGAASSGGVPLTIPNDPGGSNAERETTPQRNCWSAIALIRVMQRALPVRLLVICRVCMVGAAVRPIHRKIPTGLTERTFIPPILTRPAVLWFYAALRNRPVERGVPQQGSQLPIRTTTDTRWRRSERWPAGDEAQPQRVRGITRQPAHPYRWGGRSYRRLSGGRCRSAPPPRATYEPRRDIRGGAMAISSWRHRGPMNGSEDYSHAGGCRK